MKSKKLIITVLFLVSEIALYMLILATNNKWYMFFSIALCLAYSLIHSKTGDHFITIALSFTLIADFFLVICTEQQRIWGMIFFLGAQIVYAIRLQHQRSNPIFLIIRIVSIVLAEIVTIAILWDNLDLLAIISLCYYANLIVSIIEGFSQYKNNGLFPIGMLLFLMCDTVIGLQIATSGYLSISMDSVLTQILYPGFNLAWLFYLPSQVMISLCTTYDVKSEETK